MAGAYPGLSGKPERNIGALSRAQGESFIGRILFRDLCAPTFANLGGTANISPHLRGGVYFFYHQDVMWVYFLSSAYNRDAFYPEKYLIKNMKGLV